MKDYISKGWNALRKGAYIALIVDAGAFGLANCSSCHEPDPEPDKKPMAVLVAEPNEGQVPLKVDFDGSGSYDLDGSISKYVWDFGDGEADSTPGAEVNHIYENPETYYAGLTVVNDKKVRSYKTLESILVNPEQIVFWSDRDAGTGEIYTMYIDGTNVKRLTTNGVNDLYPKWSPDGKKIVFASGSEDTNGDGLTDIVLHIMDYDGKNSKRLTPDGLEYAAGPVWSKDGKIYFNYWDLSGGIQGIASINPDGSDFKKIISESGDNLSGRPAVSPDGSQIGWVSFRDGNPEIYIANSDGTNERNLTNNSSADYQPAWTLDGSKIAFISDRRIPSAVGEIDLFLADVVTGEITSLTDAPGREMDIAFSSDGKNFLFTEVPYVNGPYNIYKASLANPNQWEQITHQGNNRYPDWKPK